MDAGSMGRDGGAAGRLAVSGPNSLGPSACRAGVAVVGSGGSGKFSSGIPKSAYSRSTVLERYHSGALQGIWGMAPIRAISKSTLFVSIKHYPGTGDL